MRVIVKGRRMFFDVDGAKFVADGPVVRARPTVVLLHGGPGMDHSSFKPAFAPLAQFAQLVYLDHAGQGRSDHTSPDLWRLEVWADAIRDFCDTLAIDKPIVLGWSFGGMVAMAYAARHPSHPAKLILLTTAATLSLAEIRSGFERVGGRAAADAAVAHFTAPSDETWAEFVRVAWPAYSPGPIDEALFARATPTPGLSLGTWPEAFTFDLRPALSRITCPTLVLAGDADPITPPEKAEEIVAHLSPGVGRLIRYRRSGHFVQDTEAEALLADLTAFMTG